MAKCIVEERGMKFVSASVGCVYTMLGQIAKLVLADLLDLIHRNKCHAKADRLSKKRKARTVSDRERPQESFKWGGEFYLQ